MVVVNNADTIDIFTCSKDDESPPVLPSLMIRCKKAPAPNAHTNTHRRPCARMRGRTTHRADACLLMLCASAVEVGSNCHAARCCRWSDGKVLGDSPHLALVLRDDFAQPTPAPTEAVIALGKSMAAPLQTLVANELRLGPDQPVPATATLKELFARKGAAALSHIVGCIAKEFGATPANAADMTLADLAKVIGSARLGQWVGCAIAPPWSAGPAGPRGGCRAHAQQHSRPQRHLRRTALAGRLRPTVEKGARLPTAVGAA